MIRKIWRLISLYRFKKLWRTQNGHNETYVCRLFPSEIVSVGRCSYGPIDIRYWGSEGEGLMLGSYVSVAEGVLFVLGGNHRTSGLTTFPIRGRFLDSHDEPETKGPIHIGDDSWLGIGATILSGVSVGQGAVVAAGAMVAKDVPPFAVVAGNPAVVVRYRFEKDLRDEMSRVDWGSVPSEWLVANQSLLSRTVSREWVDEVFPELEQIGALRPLA